MILLIIYREELFGQPGTAVLATNNVDGTIRMTPLLFETQHEGTIVFNTFENSAVVKNLRRDARCSVLIDATAPWADGPDPGYGVHFWGSATIEGPINDVDGMEAMFTRYVDGKREQARSFSEALVSYGDRVYVSFEPDRDVSWDFRMG